MREIKFRAWDRKLKEIFQVHEIEWCYIENTLQQVTGYTGDTGGWKIVHGGGGNNHYAKEFRYILMQYTGLKDKNGTEIYEGDIVIVNGVFMESDYKTTVAYLDGAFYPLVYVRENYNCIDDYYPEKFEVIGNIYENPELLESEDEDERD